MTTEEELKKLIRRKLPTDQKLKRVDIFIMKWLLPDIESKCVENIVDSTDHPYRLVVYDTRPLSIIGEETKCGINTAKIWNKFIRESICDYICIMDSDAFPKKGWIEEIMKVFDRYPDAGVVVPTAASGVPEIQKNPPANPGIPNEEDSISGYCFVFKKEIIDDVGYFDEDFYYFGQDHEWFNRVKKSDKWNLYICPSAKVAHGNGGWSFSTRYLSTDRASVWDPEVDSAYSKKLMKKKT